LTIFLSASLSTRRITWWSPILSRGARYYFFYPGHRHCCVSRRGRLLPSTLRSSYRRDVIQPSQSGTSASIRDR